VAADRSLARLAALAGALDALAAAASTASADGLAAVEASLEAAVAELPSSADLSMYPAAEVRAHLQRIALALRRCRRIGSSLSEFATTVLAAQGIAPAYAPAGASSHLPRLGRLEVRA
jgi:hypothetical protein